MSNKIIKGCSFHHVALQTSDFEKSLKFYTEVLGFELYRQWTSGSGKTVALIDMGCCQFFEIFSDGKKSNSTAEVPAGTYFHLALKVSNVKDTYEKAISGGAQAMTPPKQMALPSVPPIPVTLAFIKGPDGEQIEFFCPEE